MGQGIENFVSSEETIHINRLNSEILDFDPVADELRITKIIDIVGEGLSGMLPHHRMDDQYADLKELVYAV